jgi:hypothetical protein
MLVRHAGCGGEYLMHHALLAVHGDMRLQTEEPLVAFPGLVHLGIAIPGRVLGRAGRMYDARVHDVPVVIVVMVMRMFNSAA